MKQINLLIIFICLSFYSFSQTALPYYSGFDNISQRNGWHNFRLGYNGTSDWGVVSYNPYSTPNCLYHDYPVGSSTYDTTMDWFVSPGFDFSSGGKIDSLKARIYSITGSATSVDEISLYLLTVSNNPANATSVTLIATLKGLVSSKTSWHDTGNFIIPPTSGTSFIGIKYQATNNWFVISIDNIYISGNPSGINADAESKAQMIIYPNPGTDKINISFTGIKPGKAELTFTNTFGEVVLTKQITQNNNSTMIDVSQFSPGSYFLRAITENDMVLNQKFIIVK
jgi:hypothetical protein